MTDGNIVLINSAKTCAFTGHRTLYKNFDEKIVKKETEKLIKDGYDTFLIGMAIGFDTECFKILLEIKKEQDIKIVACVPCENQSARFNLSQKKEYEKLLSLADEKIVISKEYSKDCMKKRNEFMVNNSSALIAYLKRDYGGTSQTVKLAEKKNIKIIFV